MPRYIDADKAKNELDEYYKHIFASEKRQSRKGMLVAISLDCKAVIDACPTADVREVMASAWIPVSERLPELDMTKPDECICLIWCDDGVGYDIGYYTNENLFSPNGIGEPHWIRNHLCNVVAWMPMPKEFEPEKGVDE